LQKQQDADGTAPQDSGYRHQATEHAGTNISHMFPDCFLNNENPVIRRLAAGGWRLAAGG
jgi:hypothetical protein